jgi:pimeloyl-ACP methyl ester carboxylesterase
MCAGTLHRIPAPGAKGIALGILERRGDAIDRRLPPVMLVHGATLGANLFDLPRPNYSLMTWLARQGRAVYALDVRGFGNSLGGKIMDAEPSAHAPFARAEDAVCDIAAALDLIRMREHAERVDLVGFSWGTLTSALYATRSPERIARLALYAPLYAEGNTLWLNRIGDPADRSRLSPRTGAYRLVTEKELTSRWDADLPTSDPALYRETGIPELVFETFAALDPRSRATEPAAFRCPTGPLADLIAVFNGRPLYDARGLTMPTLLVRGSDDTTSTDTDARRLLAAVPSDRKSYCVISPGSHFLIIEKSRFELYQQLTDFLAPMGH